jgi:CubicO group peptidase (beta-lactamase class C family)
MANLEQVTPLGSAFSYNNAALNLAGHLIEKVTGKVYEHVMKELLYDPIGLHNTFFFPVDVMTRRFAVGHRQEKDDSIVVARPWALRRASCPAGGFGVSSTIGDQIKWARFHLGDGRGADGKRVLSKELLDLMKQPTYDIRGSALGDSVGISWFLRDVEGVQLCSHGGDVIGQHSTFAMVPERDFAVAIFTNCDGSGSQLKELAEKWALEAFLGVIDKDPEPMVASEEVLAQYTGTYETVAAVAEITAADGRLILNVAIKPEAAKDMFEKEEDIPEQPPIPLGLLDGPGDRYIVADGVAKGMRGYFARGEDGKVQAVHVGGRLATRVPSPVPA